MAALTLSRCQISHHKENPTLVIALGNFSFSMYAKPTEEDDNKMIAWRIFTRTHLWVAVIMEEPIRTSERELEDRGE